MFAFNQDSFESFVREQIDKKLEEHDKLMSVKIQTLKGKISQLEDDMSDINKAFAFGKQQTDTEQQLQKIKDKINRDAALIEDAAKQIRLIKQMIGLAAAHQRGLDDLETISKI